MPYCYIVQTLHRSPNGIQCQTPQILTTFVIHALHPHFPEPCVLALVHRAQRWRISARTRTKCSHDSARKWQAHGIPVARSGANKPESPLLFYLGLGGDKRTQFHPSLPRTWHGQDASGVDASLPTQTQTKSGRNYQSKYTMLQQSRFPITNKRPTHPLQPLHQRLLTWLSNHHR
jgi:hypothetical protein